MWNPRVRRMVLVTEEDGKRVFNPMTLQELAASMLKTEAYVAWSNIDNRDFTKLIARDKRLEPFRQTISMAYYNRVYLDSTYHRWCKPPRWEKWCYMLQCYRPSGSDSESSYEGTDWFDAGDEPTTSPESSDEEKEPIPGNTIFKKVPHS